ncbi:MAG: hypothetical protein ACE5D1_08470 [Fidelibacterota bacterium]
MTSVNLYSNETRALGLTNDDIVQPTTGLNARLTTTWTVIPGTEVMFMAFYRSPMTCLLEN